MIFVAHHARFVNEIFRHLRTIRRGLIFSVTYDTIYTLTANGGGKYVADNKASAGTVAQKSSSQKTADKNNDKRYRRGLRNKPYDVLLSFQGHI